MLVALAIGISGILPGERDYVGYTFANFTNEYGKIYSSDEERGIRRTNFEATLREIVRHNSQPEKSWFAKVNEFSDLSLEEFTSRRAHGVKRGRAARAARATRPTPKGLAAIKPEALPVEIDWRTKGVVTKIKNQGGCGSCWAFSATETLESAAALATGKAPPVLAPQQLVSCSPNPKHCGGDGGCDGSTQELAFEYTETAGLSLESEYPYRAVTGTCDQGQVDPVVFNKGYEQLQSNNYTQLLAAVATVGPIAISIAASSMAFQIYGGGVYDGKGCGWIEDHAVGLVGYGTDAGKMYWIVRNSWGASWGEEGYMRLERFGEGKEPCGVDDKPLDGSACEGDTKPITLCGSCGVLSDSSYPTGVTAS